MVKSNYRTAAEGKHVAGATRRRRRILQAGFFFISENEKEPWLLATEWMVTGVLFIYREPSEKGMLSIYKEIARYP